MRKVAILGAGGAGKTVLARQLGGLLRVPVTHLDALRYDPFWNLVPDGDFAAAQRGIVAGPRWIIDGNSLATLFLRVEAADTIIVLDLHPAACLWGIFCRRLRYRGGQRADGVFDRITVGFLRYVWGYRRTHLPRVLGAIGQHAGAVTVLRLGTRRDVRRFLADAASEQDD